MFIKVVEPELGFLVLFTDSKSGVGPEFLLQKLIEMKNHLLTSTYRPFYTKVKHYWERRYSPKIIFLEMGPSNVIEDGESENRDPGVQMCVVYVVANVVLENSKIVKSI